MARIRPWQVVAGALVGASVGCTPAPEGMTTVQQMRSAPGAESSAFVGFDILGAGPDGQAFACGDGDLSVQVSVSTTGVDGEYVPIPEGEIEMTCSDPGRGEVALVVDNSGSEEGYIEPISGAASDLAAAVHDAGGSTSLVRVSTRAHVWSELTDSAEDAIAAAESLWINNGWTALWDGVRLGGDSLGGAVGDADVVEHDSAESYCASSARRAIAVYTDAQDNNSAEEHPCQTCMTPPDGIDTTADDLANLRVDGATVPVYTIGVGEDPDHDQLQAIADATGGMHFAIDEHDGLLDLLPRFAGYVDSTNSVCFELPEAACEPVFVRIEYTWNIDGETIEETSIQEVNPCPEEEPVCGWTSDGEMHSLIGWYKVDVQGSGEVLGAGPEGASARSNGRITLRGNGLIDGNAITSDIVKLIGNGATVTGEIVEDAPLISLVSAADVVAAASQANDNGSIPLTEDGVNPVESGPSLKLKANDRLVLPAGDYYFVDIDIVGGSTLEVDGEVRIYLDGPAKLAGNTTTSSQDPRDLLLISSSDRFVQLVGTSTAHMGIYAPEASVKVAGTQEITGAITAKVVTVEGTAAAIVHDQSLEGLCAVPR